MNSEKLPAPKRSAMPTRKSLRDLSLVELKAVSGGQGQATVDKLPQSDTQRSGE